MSSAYLEKLLSVLFLVFASVNLSSAAGNVTQVSNCSECDTFATCTTVNSTVFQCECDTNFTGNGTYCLVSPFLECATSTSQGFGMRITLNKTFFDVNSISQNNLRLINDSCVPTLDSAGFYVFETPSYPSCGSVQSNDSNNVIFSNAVSTDGGLISGPIISIPVVCSLASRLTISPTDSNGSSIFIVGNLASGTSVHFDTIVGGSTLSATMFLFKDSNYVTVYNGIPLLTTTDQLYVKIELNVPVNNLNLVVKECWGTPDIAGLQLRHGVIDQPGCINSGVQGGLITKNGIANDARFQFQVFQFISFDAVYLHCALELCSSGNCIPSCPSTGRKRRDAPTKRYILRSTIIIKTSHPLSLPNSDATGTRNDQFWLTIVLLSVAVAVIFICLFIIVFLCRRREREKPKNVVPVSSKPVIT